MLGALIGLQRQYTQKPAGIRTHSLVSLGACAFADYSALLHDTRIAAGIITGIGFLGAGAIVRQGFAARGLTTAASIWTASAIGTGIGLGGTAWLPIAVGIALLTLLVLSVSDDAIMRALPHRTRIAIRIEIDADRVTIDGLTAELAGVVDAARQNGDLEIERAGDRRRAVVGYIIQLDVHKELAHVFEAVSGLDGVRRVCVADEAESVST